MALTDGDHSRLLSSSLPLDALDQLARLHRESRETSRLARFLASSVHAAFLFMLMSALVLFLGRTETIGRDFSWALMILVGVLALLECYIRTHAALFSGAPSARAKELRMVFLYMGFGWGSGAFLVLPPDPGTLAVLLFVALPGVALALLLPDAMGFTFFMVPAGLTVIGAALICGFPHAGLDMSLILILQWGLFSGALLRNREPHSAALRQG
ncbi:MAG TPA: hypothetical protein VH019_03255 [Rhizomicrobium sp.]|nr:hypothetical protein [Rhizomicrobium sp.]